MIDLQAEYLNHKSSIDQTLHAILAQGNYIQGSEVESFEVNLAKYLNVKHVISCGNGTDALQIALMAINLQPHDEVILPAFSYIAAMEVVCLLGATPVLVDVDPAYFQLDIDKLKEAITPKTKAIIPVHLFGQAGDLDEIIVLANDHEIKIIEDNAQALGAKFKETSYLGTLGHIGCTSFFPTKNLGCFGDGGALFTNDDQLAKQIRSIANHGQEAKYHHQRIGLNSRLDTLQAGVLNVKLNHLESTVKRKREIANIYHHELKELPYFMLPKQHPKSQHTWHQYTISMWDDRRDQLKEYLKNNEIDSMIYYPKPVNAQPAYLKYEFDGTVAEELSRKVLSLPIHPLLTDEDIARICNTIKNYFKQ